MRSSGRWACMASFLLLAGCGVGQANDGPAGDVLYLRSRNGVAVIRAGAQAPSYRGYAVPSGDWSTVVSSMVHKNTTSVTAVDPRTGGALWKRELPGWYMVKLVSADGATVVLAPGNQIHFRLGRRKTRLVIDGGSMDSPRGLTLEGNYEPEALSVDGSTLFLIRYLPALHPNRYQVRQLDIESGEVSAVYTPDADLQKAMGGTARVQTAAPDGSRLYTLYTTGADGSRRAFVHTLALDDLWAHCIDLPASFAVDAESSTALALSPDGDRLYVVNSSTGQLAEVDTQTLQVLGTTSIDVDDSGPTTAVHDGESTLYVATGVRLTAIDVHSLTQTNTWALDHEIKGLQVPADSGQLYVAFRDAISVLDRSTGEQIDSIDPPGVKRIDELGPVFPEVNGGRESIDCAC